MEVIKKIISLEHARARGEGELYGTLTATSFYFKVQLTQNIDDLGLFTDYSFIPSFILDREITMEEKTLRLQGTESSHWFKKNGEISGYTDSKREGIRSYNPINPYIIGFDIEREDYINFSGETINGVSRVTNLSGDMITYVYDANNDVNIGTPQQNTGILYREDMSNLNDDATYMKYNSEGWNETNSQLSAIIKEEYLIGITSPPEIKNDVFIDRGIVTVMESHLRMSEIESLDHLIRYGNGFFNIVRQ